MSGANFLCNTPKKRWHICALMVFLLSSHLFFMFSARETHMGELLRSGEITTIQVLEKTGSGALLPSDVNKDCGRFRLILSPVCAALVKMASGREKDEPFSDETRRLLDEWVSLIGKELASQPHSDMVLRN